MRGADGQNRKESRRHQDHGEGEGDHAGPHPVDEAVRGFVGVLHEPVVGAFRLAEDLDDLDPADVFHRRVVQRFCRLNRVRVEPPARRHHEDVAEHPEGNGRKGRQPHPPVHGEDIDKDGHGQEQVCRELRHDVGKGRLDGVDPLDQGIFQRSGAFGQNRAEGHPGQLLRAPLPDLAEDREGRPVACRGAEGVEEYPSGPEERGGEAPDQIEGQVPFPFHQTPHDADHGEIRGEREGDTDHGENHREDVLSPVPARLSQDPRDRGRRSGRFRLFVHKQTSLRFCSLTNGSLR